MGFHFMTVPVMQLVELIRRDRDGIKKPLRLCRTCRWKNLGKNGGLRPEDFPAFIVNRILMPDDQTKLFIACTRRGVVKSIDSSLKLGAKPPNGPARACRFQSVLDNLSGHY